MNTPFFPLALRHSTIGPVRNPRQLTAGCWSGFAARLRACTDVDRERVSALQQSLASGVYVSDAVAIANRLLATLLFRRH